MQEEFKPYKHDNILGDFYKHPTFGIMQFNRGQGTARPLFGSSILHSETITLTISRAELARSLGSDHIFDRDTIVEVTMSPTQFADAITGLNCGNGVPVTIRLVNEQKHENLYHVNPPFSNKVQQFNQEFENKIVDLGREFDKVISLAEETHAQVRLKKALELLKMWFNSNTPFIAEQFSEQMDKTVTEAKGQVEAFTNRVIQSYGIEAIRKQAPQLPETRTVVNELPEGKE